MSLKKILIVEDEIDIIKVVKCILKMGNYEIVECMDGESCWEILNNQKIDIVILDLLLPDINGVEILKKIKENPKLKKTKIIVCTALWEKDINEEVKKYTDDYILKPFDPYDLFKKIENLI